MKIAHWLLVFSFVGVQPLLAADQSVPVQGTTDEIIIPSGSTLRLSSAEDEVAKFEGRVLLTGTYYYGDAEYNDDPKTFFAEAAIFLDEGAELNLPRWLRHGPDGKIFITNAQEFAKQVLSPALLARVGKKGGGNASGHISIWVDAFEATLACDSASYSAHFLSLQSAPAARLAANTPSLGC